MPHTPRHNLALALLFITPALWSVNYLVARSAPGVIEPHALASLRWLFASVLFSLVSGWVMFFKRRPPGSLGLPRLLPGAWTSPSALAWLVAAGMCALMPLLLVSGGMLVLLELGLAKCGPRVGRIWLR